MRVSKGVILFFTVIILSFVIFYMVNVSITDQNIKKILDQEIREVQEEFRHLTELDMKMLSSTLNVIIQDPGIKKIYMEKDREKLYSYTLPLFEKLKGEYGITHWYFILPDGHTFLRVHNKDISDDEITRFTFFEARDTQKVGKGVELGKTAYALRVVMPYYYEGELIGYVELGEEIDHFLRLLEEETGDEIALVAKKEYLNKDKWASVRSVAGLRNNWDDSKRYLLISPLDIGEESNILSCFYEENIKEGEKGKLLFQEIKKQQRYFRCAGFPLIDAGNRQSGMILLSMNIKDYKNFERDSNLIILGFLILIFILISLASYFLFLRKEDRNGK